MNRPRVLYISQRFSVHDARFFDALRPYVDLWFLPLEADNLSSQKVLVPLFPRPKRGHPFRWGGVLPWAEELRQACHERGIHVIHAGPIPQGSLIPVLMRWHPFLAMSWGWDVLWQAQRAPSWKALSQWVLSQADMALGDCHTVARALRELGFRGPILHFPWCGELTGFSPGHDHDLRRQWGWDDAIVVLHVRSWDWLYNVDTVLLGFALAAARNERLRLLMIGSGPLAPRIHAFLHDHPELRDKIRLPGHIPEPVLPRYFRAADIYVSASLTDGTSISLLQALATGLPVVVSDLPGNREWVKPGREGLVFSPLNAEALAKALHQVQSLPDKHQRHAQARAFREHVSGLWRRGIQSLVKWYHVQAIHGAPK